MNDFETLTVEEPREGVVLAMFNRPEQLKAITFEMFDECEPTWRRPSGP